MRQVKHIILWVLLVSCSAMAQDNTSLKLKQMSFSAELESRLNSDVERVIGTNKHILSVRSEFVYDAKTASNKTDSIDMDISDAPDLPGLSGMPAIDEPKPAKKAVKEPMIRSFNTKLILDQSVTAEQEQLLRGLLLQKLEYDPMRGDQFSITRAELDTASAVDEIQSLWDEYWPLIAALAALLLLLLIWFIVRRSSKKKDADVAPVTLDKPTSPEALLDMKKGELKAIREKLVKQSLSEPEKTKEVMSSLSLNEQNLPMLSSTYQELGRALFTSMYPTLVPNIPSYLKYLEENPTDYDGLVRHLTDLNHLLSDAQSSDQFENKVKPFGFLERMTDNQIRWVLDDESDRVKAVVLCQLSTDKASKLLTTFNAQTQTQLAIEIAQFKSMPMTTFNEVAASLAVKARSVPDFNTIAVDGTQLLIKMLDSMNLSQAEALVSQLKSSSPDIYLDLRQVYYMFEDILRTPANVLSNHLRTMEPKTLALALSEFTEEQVGKVLSSFPERFVAMLKQEIQQVTDLDKGNVESAKQQVTLVIREALKNKQFSMNDLEV
tara:strand:- start:1840 stop:3489 length:1650 start_codon:yes stop_codon:yes gene_type:complete